MFPGPSVMKLLGSVSRVNTWNPVGGVYSIVQQYTMGLLCSKLCWVLGIKHEWGN